MSDTAALWNVYVDAFLTTSRVAASQNQLLIDRPDMVGTLGTQDRNNGRLLILADTALDNLQEITDPRASFVEVHSSATRLIAHMNQLSNYQPEHVTAMVRSLTSLPEMPLDPHLRLVPATIDAADGSARLEDAAAANLRADPVEDLTPAAFAGYLSSISGATLLAAIDDEGSVRATAGSAVFEQFARVFFVSTDRAWRARGIGTAMTMAALKAAVDRGATTACLAASASGRSIYERLGFAAVADLVLFENLS